MSDVPIGHVYRPGHPLGDPIASAAAPMVALPAESTRLLGTDLTPVTGAVRPTRDGDAHRVRAVGAHTLTVSPGAGASADGSWRFELVGFQSPRFSVALAHDATVADAVAALEGLLGGDIVVTADEADADVVEDQAVEFSWSGFQVDEIRLDLSLLEADEGDGIQGSTYVFVAA